LVNGCLISNGVYDMKTKGHLGPPYGIKLEEHHIGKGGGREKSNDVLEINTRS
jgi:hypothetical protein